MARYSILVIDDEKNMRESLQDILEDEGYRTLTVDNGRDGLNLLQSEEIHLVTVDVRMPGMTGFEFLSKARTESEDLPIIIITAFGTVKQAVRAIKNGAYDYITKPFNPEEILIVIKKALDYRRLKEENKRLLGELGAVKGLREIIGQGSRAKDIRQMIETVAPTPSTVLIEGESGTGKELVARAIHSQSDRRDFAFVSVNCAALPETLLESELFGHEKGAFTGALQLKKGKFEIADKGTIYLDEIGDMTLLLQSKILRVLQEREFTRVGGNRAITTDVRVVAATNIDIKKALAEGRFREDLYYRLNVLGIKVPPLRERVEDIPLLAHHFLEFYSRLLNKRFSTIADEGMRALQAYSWPGNIRELENVIERAVILEKTGEITCSSIPDNILEQEAGRRMVKRGEGEVDFKKAVSTFERRIIEEALAEAHGNITRAARLLGLTRYSLHYQMEKLGLTKGAEKKTS